MKEAVLYRKLADGKVECQACSWYCKIAEGQTGVCGVRANIGGKLQLLVYGKTTGLAIDPIEKKPFYHFLPTSTALSFGTYGCDFGCLFCQNWESSQAIKIQKAKFKIQNYNSKFKIIDTIKDYIDRTSVEVSPREIVEEAIKNNCQSIAYTYNEPAVFVEFAYDTMKLAKKAGLKNVFVSNGFESKECFRYIKDYIDAINIDLKGATEEFYSKYCKGRLKPVLESIERFFRAGIWVEVTTLLIEGVNDSEKDLRWMAKFIKGVSPTIPWHLSAMHPDYKMREGRVTPFEVLKRAYEIGKSEGLKYVYAYTTERTSDLDSTFCPKCGELLIERRYFDTNILDFKEGKCLNCGERIEGVWK